MPAPVRRVTAMGPQADRDNDRTRARRNPLSPTHPRLTRGRSRSLAEAETRIGWARRDIHDAGTAAKHALRHP